MWLKTLKLDDLKVENESAAPMKVETLETTVYQPERHDTHAIKLLHFRC